MGGPPITFPTPNFLIRTILRKVAFYAPLPHFENPCLLELPIAVLPLSRVGIHCRHRTMEEDTATLLVGHKVHPRNTLSDHYIAELLMFVGRPLRAEARQSCYESQSRTIH